MKMYVHADDFGWNNNICSDIADCIEFGSINSISIIINSIDIDYNFDLYRSLFKKNKIRLCLHLNLVEGKPVILNESSVLVNRNGEFKYTFISLWIKYIFSSAFVKKQINIDLKKEMSAQIEKFSKLLKIRDPKLNIDSHTHVHMIPFVFDALESLIKKYRISYIRIPNELFFFSSANIKNYLSSNLIKNFLLKYLSIKSLSKLKKHNNCNHTDYFVGVLFTGNMKLESINKALSKIVKKKTFNFNNIIDILFHPGGERDIYQINWTSNNAFKKYYNSKNRNNEKKLLINKKLNQLINKYENIFNS